MAECFTHLKDIAHFIPPVDERINIELLVGRVFIIAHYVLDHRIGKNNKTAILSNVRPTTMISCDSVIKIDFGSVFRMQYEKPGLSVEYKNILKIINSGIQKTDQELHG